MTHEQAAYRRHPLDAEAPTVADRPQTDLRDRIAEALYAHDHPGHLVPLNETGMGPAYRESADAVLAVLPPPADRAAVLLDAAAECNRAGGAYAGRGADVAAGAAFALMETFLRKAGDAEYAATPCTAPNVCEDGGEPCEAHERILGHIEGYHDLCAPDCGQDWQRRLAAEAQQQPEGDARP